MTEQEAIKIIDCNRPYEAVMRKTEKEAFDMAIKALEKQIPKKPIALQHGDYRCPLCNRILRMFEAINFCMFCGRLLIGVKKNE